VPLGLIAQASADAAYDAKQRRAEELFAQGKRLEALPLLEELVRANPKNDAMLVALAACLVDHAATLSDPDAAGRERLRARNLLEQAWQLGNRSQLAMNLSQLLRQLPPSGAIKFSDNPRADEAMRAGEAAFSRRDFDAARRHYAKALELEPQNYAPALFIGNTYDRQNQFAKAAEWYERAIRLAPDVETAYRYYADMLARQGDMARARLMLIHAAVAEPYNRMVWRELHAWATLNHTQLNEIYISVPPASNAPAEHRPAVGVSAVWQAYRTVKSACRDGGRFRTRFPEETEYRHSLPEESESLTAAAEVLQKLKSDDNGIGEAIRADPSLGLLVKLYERDLIDPYVLFSLGDSGIARDYPAYRATHRQKLEEYLDKLVVPSLH